MRISDWSSDVCSSDLLSRSRDRLSRRDALPRQIGNDATPCVSPPVAGVGEREHEAIGPLFSRNLRRTHGARGARRAAPIRSLRRITCSTSSILPEFNSPLPPTLSRVDRDEFALEKTSPLLSGRVSKADMDFTD